MTDPYVLRPGQGKLLHSCQSTHPKPANAAPPSMIAEMLVSTIAPQCMLWQTSPAATEMETRMLDWQTRVDERIAIRFQVGQFDATAADVDTACDVLTELAGKGV